MIERREWLNVHSEVTSQECHGQEDDGNVCELFECFVGVCCHRIEDEINHVVAGAAHLI